MLGLISVLCSCVSLCMLLQCRFFMCVLCRLLLGMSWCVLLCVCLGCVCVDVCVLICVVAVCVCCYVCVDVCVCCLCVC